MRDITFRHANDRPPVALIGAAPSADADQLSTIRRALEAEGWQTVPASIDGRQMLQVNGFKDEGELASMLMTRQFARGTPTVQDEPGDHPTRTAKEWLEDNSLKTGGVLNLLGDAALLFSGLKSGRSKEAYAGGLYTAGALVAAQYGNVKTEYHVHQVSERMAEYLRDQAAVLPEDCGLYSILKDKRDGVLKNGEDFLYRYPSQTTLGVYTLGALAMLQSGMKHKKGWDMAYGANSVATKVASILVPEKGAAELTEGERQEKAKHGPVGKVIDWVHEKPLRIFGYGSMVSDALLGMSAYREYRADPRQKSYIFKFLTTGTYLLADLMFAISSKNPAGTDDKFDAEEQRRVEALAAEAIAGQPRAMQQPLANQVAAFLSTQPELNGRGAEIAVSIMHQVDEAQHNPWSCHADKKPENWEQRVFTPPAGEPQRT